MKSTVHCTGKCTMYQVHACAASCRARNDWEMVSEPRRGVCWNYFNEGVCFRRDRCKYIHTRVQQYKSNEICRDYGKGNCKAGPACKFRHDLVRSSREMRQHHQRCEPVVPHPAAQRMLQAEDSPAQDYRADMPSCSVF